jgi:ATP-dependent RNA helicase HrpB
MNAKKLPIEAIKIDFIAALKTQHTLILSAPPGAGKSTCLPLWLLAMAQFSQQKIFLLQPRRVAVKNIALYLASQLGEPVGQRVGYRLRNESKISKNTHLEVITEGILTQIMQNDAELNGCALVIFDEFHERSLHGDLAFALARDIQQGLREDLKILLMSATLDSHFLSEKLTDALTLNSEGRCYPVDVSYRPAKNSRSWRDHALVVIKAQMQQHQGSILVFLPGVGDIRYLADKLNGHLAENTDLFLLYGNLTLKQQQQVIVPSIAGRYKLVLSTNIAETSLTIDGINCVIDCGFEKRAVYDQGSLTNKLLLQQISKASAIQRTGRAGRLMAGVCIRLYAKDDFDRRQEQPISEIQQADLLPTLIEAARWGVNELAALPMLELPSAVKEQQAWQELHSLAIVEANHTLTKHGKQVAQLSCHPRFAHMILSAKSLAQYFSEKNYSSLACFLAALLEERDIFSSVFQYSNCDLRQRMQVLLNSSADSSPNKPSQYSRIWQQAQRLSQQANITLVKQAQLLPIAELGVLLALAYPERVAKARLNSCGDFLCANGKGILVDESDALAGETFIVAANIFQMNKAGQTPQATKKLSVRLAAPITLAQIEQLFAQQIITNDVLIYNQQNEKIIARQQTQLAALVLAEKNIMAPLQAEKISAMWCGLVQQKGLDFLNWQAKDNQLKNRCLWLYNFVHQTNFPELSEAYLREHLALWFAPFVGKIKNKNQLNKLDLSAMLLSLLDYQQQLSLNKLAPEYYRGPTGRRCLISYESTQQSPKVSLPMQEVYGLQQTPSVGFAANKAIPLILELLSPAGRPIQVTQNLPQFWQGSYRAVQKDMRAQYPKHFWPDDPANAQATNKTKRHLKIPH